MVTPPALIAATPVGARMTKRLDVVPVIYLRNVVLPVPAFPVRKIDNPVSFTYLSAVSKIKSFSISMSIPTFFPKLLYFIVKCGLFMINLPFNSDKNKNNRFTIALGAFCEPILSVKVGNN